MPGLMSRRSLLAGTGAAMAAPALAQSRIPIKFSLNLPYNGTNLPFVYGRERGFFAEQGFDITAMDPAAGSDAVTRLASSAYDVSFGDITSLPDLYAQQPDYVPLAVFNIYKTTPAAIITWRKDGITKPADLIGKTIGAPPTDNAFLLFPAFARVNGLDVSKVNIKNVDLRVRDAMFLRREFVGVTGFDSTVWLNLKSNGAKLEDLFIMYYSDFGLDLYSNSVLVSRKFLRDHEKAIPALLVACKKCWTEARADPDAATQALARSERLTNPTIERERFEWVLTHQVFTEETTRLGLGNLDVARLQRGLDILDTTAGRTKQTPASAIWSGAYLPPA
jgi:NitT/TauT family transport system substrate-binding protein